MTDTKAPTLEVFPKYETPTGSFDPLPGSNPVPLVDCTNCKWPVTVEGNMLFCNEPVEYKPTEWCAQHKKIGISPRALKKLKATKDGGVK